MTDDRNVSSEPAAEPPAPPSSEPPPAVTSKPKPWGLIAAALAVLAAILLAILYFTGAFGGGERRPGAALPANSGAEAPAPATENLMGDTSGGDFNGVSMDLNAAAAAPAGGGQVNAAWLQGAWGQACPGTNDPDVTFLVGGRFRLGADAGHWTLSGNTVTITVDGRPQNSIMTWDYVTQDTARVTRVRTGDVYYVYRCPA